MAGRATAGRKPFAAEEARLARAAGAGDATAFATLYERYERRAFNLAYRICGSEHDAAEAMQEAFVGLMQRLPGLADRDLDFGAYLFASTRNACLDLIRKRNRTRAVEAIPESAAPLGSGAGGLGLDPGDPEEDPDRSQLLAAQQEEIREANMRLPERQREVLALRELEELSYEEIATVMEMNRNSVAQLISRARINLRDELRGSALSSILARSKDCERALPLIAKREDGQLDEDSEDAIWLDQHLEECDRCRVGREAMLEAGVSYRAWVPILVAPWLLRSTMAKAAEGMGADWSGAIATARAGRPDPSSLPGMPSAYRASRRHLWPRGRPRAHGGALIATGVAAMTIVVAGVVASPAGKHSESSGAAQEVAAAAAHSATAANGGSGGSGGAGASNATVALLTSGGAGPSTFAGFFSTPPGEGGSQSGGPGEEGPTSGTEEAPGAPDLAPTHRVGPNSGSEAEPPPQGPATEQPPTTEPAEEVILTGGQPAEEGEEGSGEENPRETQEEEPGEGKPEGENPRELPGKEPPPDCVEQKLCG
jgi:RNA polymerase sigma factor (sigma-70 family)